jgi:hypothetical protein
MGQMELVMSWIASSDDYDPFWEELEEKESHRKERIEEQIKMGCDKCSQWDEYFGCDKCARL